MAYLLLKYIVLKPGLKIIRGIDNIDRATQRDLTLLHEEVELQNAMVKEQWMRHCQVLRSRMPGAKKVKGLLLRRKATPLVARLSNEDELRLIFDMKNVIVKIIDKEG